MKKYNIKTIDIHAKEWFDRVNGNSYFSAIINLNYGLKDCKTIGLPYQYGYGSQYISEALRVLKDEGYIISQDTNSLSRYCDENSIILRTFKKEKCLKREVKSFTEFI